MSSRPTPKPAAEQPRENRVLAEPATPQACADDYATSAPVRARMNKRAAADRAKGGAR